MSRLRPVARRKQSQARRDAKWRKDYLAANPYCAIGPVLFDAGEDWAFGCTVFARELHEGIKRSRGGSITDEWNVWPTCRHCHEFTEHHPQRATELGLLASNPKWSASERV